MATLSLIAAIHPDEVVKLQRQRLDLDPIHTKLIGTPQRHLRR
jgi:hypothetical protein